MRQAIGGLSIWGSFDPMHAARLSLYSTPIAATAAGIKTHDLVLSSAMRVLRGLDLLH